MPRHLTNTLQFIRFKFIDFEKKLCLFQLLFLPRQHLIQYRFFFFSLNHLFIHFASLSQTSYHKSSHQKDWFPFSTESEIIVSRVFHLFFVREDINYPKKTSCTDFVLKKKIKKIRKKNARNVVRALCVVEKRISLFFNKLNLLFLSVFIVLDFFLFILSFTEKISEDSFGFYFPVIASFKYSLIFWASEEGWRRFQFRTALAAPVLIEKIIC